MSEKFIFSVGMFRSGTTFLGRIFDAHPNLAVASDPYFEFFKAFRNEIYHRSDPHWDDTEPLSDYFFEENTERFNLLQKTTFDHPLQHQALEVILQRIIEHGGKWSPLVMPYLKDVQATNYRDLWIELVKRLKKVYAKTPDSIMGCKEVWCEEMVAPFLRTFPKAKCIHILRDPRAIIASNFMRRGGGIKYPFLFLIRQWRKSVAFHLLNRNNKEQYHLIQYESLVNDPEGTLRKMCQFIEVQFSPAMLQPENYKDSAGQSWTQNSSHGTSTKINKEFSEKWKSILTPSQIQYVEDLCHHEMEFFGYNRLTEPAFFESVFSNQTIPENEISPWMRFFYQRYQPTAKNSAQEFLRLTLLQDSRRFSQELSPSTLQSIFIDRDFLTKLESPLKKV